MNPHFETVPCVGTLPARRLASGDSQSLGGHAHGTLDAELLIFGSANEICADLLKRLDITGSQGDADTLLLDGSFKSGLLDGRHVGWGCVVAGGLEEESLRTGDLRDTAAVTSPRGEQ